MKKKFLSFVLALCLIIPGIALLSACNNNSPVGTYTLSKSTVGSEIYTVEYYNALKEKYGQTDESTDPDEWTEERKTFEVLKVLFSTEITLYESGALVVNQPDIIISGTWTIDGDNLILVTTTGENTVLTATYNNNTITITTDEETDQIYSSSVYVKKA